MNPGRRADPVAGAAERTMPLPQLDDFAEQVISPALSTLDGRRRGAGVRREEVRRARRGQPDGAGRPRHRHRPGDLRDRLGELDRAGRHGRWAANQNLAIETNTQMTTADRVPPDRHRLAERQAGAARRRGARHRLGRQHPDREPLRRRAGARACGVSPAGREHGRRSSTRSRRCCPNIAADLGTSGSINILNDRGDLDRSGRARR